MSDDSNRRRLAMFLAIGGVLAAGLAFWQGEAAERSDMVAAIGGFGRGGDRTVMWLLIGVAALLLLGALLAWLSAGRQAGVSSPQLSPGWYDDPDSPKSLRYWDGVRWTEKTAEKESGP